MNSHLKGSLFIVLAMFLFSTQTVLVRYISTSIPTLLFYVHLIMMVLLLLYPLIKKDTTLYKIPKPVGIMFITSATTVINVFTAFTAFRLTTYANAMFTHYTAPIFAFLLAIIFLKEKGELSSIFTILFSTLGIALLFNASLGGQHTLGLLLGLSSGVAYGINIIANKKILKKNRVFQVLLYQTLFSLLVYTPFVSPISLSDLSMTAYIAIVSGICGVSLWFLGIKRVKGQHAGIIAYIEILFTLLWAYLFFNELPGGQIWVGGLLIIFSGMWIIYKEAKRPKSI